MHAYVRELGTGEVAVHSRRLQQIFPPGLEFRDNPREMRNVARWLRRHPDQLWGNALVCEWPLQNIGLQVKRTGTFWTSYVNM